MNRQCALVRFLGHDTRQSSERPPDGKKKRLTDYSKEAEDSTVKKGEAADKLLRFLESHS